LNYDKGTRRFDAQSAPSTKPLNNLHFIRAVLQFREPLGTTSMSAISRQVAESCESNERAGLTMSLKAAALNTVEVKTAQLSLKRILSVPCPVCRAKPKEQCTFNTGHPSVKTHIKRAVAATNASRSESSGRGAMFSAGIRNQGLPSAVPFKVGDNASKSKQAAKSDVLSNP
jgi:hypothetical protein